MIDRETQMDDSSDELKHLQQRVAELERALAEHEQAGQTWPISEQNLTDIFFNSIDALLVIDPGTGRIMKANRALHRLLGYDPTKLLGKPFTILHPPDAHTISEEDLERHLVHGAVFPAQPILKADGGIIPMDFMAISIPWGDTVAVLAVYRDVSDREDALQKLRESEYRYRTLFDQATDAIILEDAQGRILDANRAACRITGYSHAELLKMNNAQWQTIRNPSLPIEADPNLKIETPFEMIAVRNGGCRFIAETTIAPLKNEDTTLFLSITRDITKRKRAEEALKHAHDELEERVHERTMELENLAARLIREIGERKRAEERIKKSLAEKEVMLQEIHHRVKNNLQIISSLLALQGRSAENEKIAALLDDSQNRIRSMALIHAQLYESDDLSRIEFARYLKNLSKTLIRSCGEKDTSVSLKIDADPVFLSIGTAIPCGLIVNELLSNSLKHAFPDDRPKHIHVGLHQNQNKKNEYTLSVKDNGVGLPPDMDYRTSKSLGLRLITNLAEAQLRGKLEIITEEGTEVRLVFQDGDPR